jgi:hypothetical protein
MKRYTDYDNFIEIDGMWIPKQPSNRHYATFLEEQANGEAALISKPKITWDEIRTQRDSLLKRSDWVGASDAQPKPSKEAWLDYRQALRDITKNFSTPESVVWPTKPE